MATVDFTSAPGTSIELSWTLASGPPPAGDYHQRTYPDLFCFDGLIDIYSDGLSFFPCSRHLINENRSATTTAIIIPPNSSTPKSSNPQSWQSEITLIRK